MMCVHCYDAYGRPAVRSERALAAIPLIEAVFDENSVGGELHVVLDDWNLEDASLRLGGLREPNEAEVACLAALQDMTLAERATALAIFDGFLAREI